MQLIHSKALSVNRLRKDPRPLRLLKPIASNQMSGNPKVWLREITEFRVLWICRPEWSPSSNGNLRISIIFWVRAIIMKLYVGHYLREKAWSKLINPKVSFSNGLRIHLDSSIINLVRIACLSIISNSIEKSLTNKGYVGTW